MVILAPGFDPAHTEGDGRQCTSFLRRADHVHRRMGMTDFLSHETCRACARGSWPASNRPAEMMKKLIAAGIDEMTICCG